MAGLNLSVGGFGGVKSTTAPQYGSSSSYASGVTASSAAFGPGMTTPTYTGSETMSMKTPVGMATYIGIVAIAALVVLRNSLPN